MLRLAAYALCVILLLSTSVRASTEETDATPGGGGGAINGIGGANGFYTPRLRNDLQSGQMDYSLNYFLPRLTAKYRPSGQWNGITEPEYLLDTDQEPEDRFKRAGKSLSLSINNPLEVLREQLDRAIKLRNIYKSQKQGIENRKLMDTIGKRGNRFLLRQPEPNAIGYYTI